VGSSILVVDDDLDIRELLTELLKEQGFAVESAANGQEALERLASGGTKPSLIFLDLMMPIMSGWELAQILRREPEYSGIPVIVISADRDALRDAEALGVRGCLQKPVELKTFLEVARRYC
jgi:two-component system, chemotaxis family, chemotaxis protein CheY